MWRQFQRRAASTFSIQSHLQTGLLGTHADFSHKNALFRRSHQPNVDYQTSAVMSLGLPKASVLPTAESIAHEFGLKHAASVASASATKPGFINIKLQDAWIAEHAVHVATHGVKPRRQDRPQHVLVDFASPNMGKELHVGHLRSSVLGDTISNMLEFDGHLVSRISHVGDLGAAIATLLVQALDEPDNSANGLPRSFDPSTSVETLGQWYGRGKQRLGNGDVEFKATVDDTVLGLQRQDSKWHTPWDLTCAISRSAHHALYQRLGVQVTERGESKYLSLIPTVLSKLGTIASESQGFLYATTDLTALYSRVFGWAKDPVAYDRLIYVTDLSQSLHFRHLFEAAKLAGWLDGRHVTLQHAGFGLVMGEDGTKLSSRKGGATTLKSLLDHAALESQKRSAVPDADHQAIGDAAVRYYDLAQHRERNYKFSYSNVLNLKGNTAPYLMYATARLQGILRKTAEGEGASSMGSWATYLAEHPDASGQLRRASTDWHPNERALALVLGQFQDALVETQANWHPHILADYLFRVVTSFHSFYETCHVQQNPARLVLCAATDAVLRRGLHLLGIPTVDRM